MQIIQRENARKLTRNEKWELLSGFLQQHGREALAYATLQDNMEYFIDEHGYIAFVSIRHPIFAPQGKCIALSDPLAAVANYPKILKNFLKTYPSAAFMYISEACADALKQMGFRVNTLGIDSILPIQIYNSQGDWKELDLIKRARNEAKREKIRIEEVNIEDIDSAELNSLTEKWLSSKVLNDREIWIYARKPVYETERDVRKFIARDEDGQLAGYVFYDPIYRDGKVIGYCNNTTRTDEKRFGKLHTAINMAALDIFRKEGKEEMNIGLAPFFRLEEGKYNDDPITEMFFKLNWKYGNQTYNFRGLCHHKLKYRGKTLPKYFASNSFFPSNDVYLAYLSANIVSGYWNSLWRLGKEILTETFRSKTKSSLTPSLN